MGTVGTVDTALTMIWTRLSAVLTIWNSIFMLKRALKRVIRMMCGTAANQSPLVI